MSCVSDSKSEVATVMDFLCILQVFLFEDSSSVITEYSHSNSEPVDVSQNFIDCLNDFLCL